LTPAQQKSNPLVLDLAVMLNQQLNREPPNEWRILRAGPNDTEKGVFHFTRASAASVMEIARAWGNDYSADYEHANFREMGEAPAAAWYSIAIRETGDGPELWAEDIRWTDRAADRIRAKEYRYISPVLYHDDNGIITEFVNFALTNLPATRHMDALIAASKHGTPATIGASEHERKIAMETILTKLGLGADAAETEAVKNIVRLQARAALATRIEDIVGEGNEVVGTITAWRDGAAQSEAVAAERDELQTQLNARAAAEDEARVEALLDRGMKEGKLTPASRASLRTLLADDDDRVNPARLEAYLKAAPRVIPGATRQPINPSTEGRSAGTAGVDAEGKTAWDRLTNPQKVELKMADPEEFARLYAEHTTTRFGT